MSCGHNTAETFPTAETLSYERKVLAAMDYYEEFGIPRSAAPDEIRQAHRSLARLLHPDQFQDPGLKRLAENQMKRANEIFAVLSDPLRRRQYDQPVKQPHYCARYRELAGWCAAALVAIAWVCSAQLFPPAPAINASLTVPAVPELTGTSPSQPAKQVEKRRPARAARKLAALHPTASERRAPDIEEPPPIIAAVVGPVIAPPGDGPPQPAPPVSKPKGLAGRWFYLRPHIAPAVKELYPPEYIEAAISEDSGTLRGRYRARYKVADRAISPDVTFQFEGPASGDSAALPWTGGGGTHGEVRLRRISPDTLEVKWFATEMGKHLGLVSGAAVLVRRQEP